MTRTRIAAIIVTAPFLIPVGIGLAALCLLLYPLTLLIMLAMIALGEDERHAWQEWKMVFWPWRKS